MLGVDNKGRGMICARIKQRERSGRYMMPRIGTQRGLEDYKKSCAIRLKPKAA
jgi:hypothetical protein